MNISKIFLIIPFVFFNFSTQAQDHYNLELKEENWNIKPSLFFISNVLDERNDKSNAGFVLSGNKSIPANFKNSSEKDLKTLIDASMENDTSRTPLILILNRFKIKETGTSKIHKIILDFSIAFYRIINEKRYKVFETSGKPETIVSAMYSNVVENIIRETFKNSIKNFNDWINQHPDLPPLARKVNVVFENEKGMPSDEKEDNIIWNENYKLNWNDFKGSAGITSFMAQSNCIFSYRAEPMPGKGVLNLNIRLNACFDRRGSWVKSGQKKDTLLAHEQLHFDICEIYVRQLRKKILNTELNPMEFDKQINLLFEEVWKDYLLKQQQYDDETAHGIITDKQQFWQEDINNQLKNTSQEKN